MQFFYQNFCRRVNIGPGDCEALVSAVIGVSHGLALAARHKVEQQTHLRRCIIRYHRADCIEIVVIHREDMREACKIAVRELARGSKCQSHFHGPVMASVRVGA